MDAPVFVLGAAITDLMGFPQKPVAQADSVPGKIRKAPGGVGRNLAENLVRLGLPVELITAFGDDANGRSLLKHCQDQQIGIRHSILAEGQRGALHLAVLDEQKDLFAGIADLAILEVLTPAYLEDQLEQLQQGSALVLETNIPQPLIDWMMEQEWETPLYLDPVSVPFSRKVERYLGHFHTIKANRLQAEALAGRRLSTTQDLEAVAQQWLAQGTQRVFITLGGQGAFAASVDQRIHIPAAKVKVANTTGAGDAFLAGVLWATRRNWPLDDCCRAGLAASTIAVRSPEANSPDLSETAVMEYIRKFC